MPRLARQPQVRDNSTVIVTGADQAPAIMGLAADVEQDVAETDRTDDYEFAGRKNNPLDLYDLSDLFGTQVFVLASATRS
jgi:hypothetical protein